MLLNADTAFLGYVAARSLCSCSRESMRALRYASLPAFWVMTLRRRVVPFRSMFWLAVGGHSL